MPPTPAVVDTHLHVFARTVPETSVKFTPCSNGCLHPHDQLVWTCTRPGCRFVITRLEASDG